MVEKRGPQRHIFLGPAPVQLDGIKPKRKGGIDIRGEAHGAGAVIVAAAVVVVPAHGEVERVPEVRHRFHVRELGRIDLRAPVRIVVRPRRRAVASTLLPAVVESHVAVAEVPQAGVRAIH